MHVYFVFFHNVFNTQIVKSSYKIIKKPQKINENKLPMLHPRYTFSVDEPFCAFWKDVHAYMLKETLDYKGARTVATWSLSMIPLRQMPRFVTSISSRTLF